jgi:hypothetical protein
MEEEKSLPLSMPASEEVRWCEMKPKLEIKRTPHIRCGGRVLTGQICNTLKFSNFRKLVERIIKQ